MAKRQIGIAFTRVVNRASEVAVNIKACAAILALARRQAAETHKPSRLKSRSIMGGIAAQAAGEIAVAE